MSEQLTTTDERSRQALWDALILELGDVYDVALALDGEGMLAGLQCYQTRQQGKENRSIQVHNSPLLNYGSYNLFLKNIRVENGHD